MPHQEKTSWLSLIAIVLTFGPYFAVVANTPPRPLPDLHMLIWFAMAVVAQIVVQIVGHVWFAVRSPEDASTPADERDHAIQRRSISWAYYVLMVGMILVGCVMPFNSSGWAIINAAIFMIVVAEVVHYGMMVFSYRRQA